MPLGSPSFDYLQQAAERAWPLMKKSALASLQAQRGALDPFLEWGHSLLATPLNLLQAMQAPGPAGPIPIPGASMKVPQTEEERGRQIARAATLGVSGLLEAVEARAQRELSEPRYQDTGPNLQDKLDAYMMGGLKTAIMDVLPGQELKNLLTWKTSEGKPMDPRSFGQTASTGLLKTLLIGKPMSTTVRTRGKYQNPYIQDVITKGQIDAAKTALKQAEKGEIPIVEVPRMPLEAAPQAVATRRLLDIPETRHVVTTAMFTRAFQKLLAEEYPKNRQVTDIINRAITEKIIEPRQVAAIAQREGLTMDEAATALANSLREVSSFSGQTLEAYSRPVQLMMGELASLAKQGDREAYKLLRRFERRMETPTFEANLSDYSAGSRAYKWLLRTGRKVEAVRRSALVSQLATSLRNAKAQGLNSAVKMAEDALAGFLEQAFSTSRDPRPLSVHYGELLGDFVGLYHRLPGQGRAALEATLDNLPLVQRLLDNSSTFEIYTTTIGGLLKKQFPEGAAEWAKAFPDLVGTPNRLQEIEFRRWHFDAKLTANLKREGWTRKRYDDVIAKDPEGLPPNMVEATADALEHALKMTWSARPTGGIAKGIMSTYQYIPFSTAILPTFPRFMANSWRWILDHNPTQLFNVFDKEFRAKLQAGAEGGFRSAEAYQTLARGISGMSMLMAAWHFRNSDVAGPKYYQVKTGVAPDGTAQFDDIRQYQPFSQFAFIADSLKAAVEGRPMNINANELIDALTGMRRIGEVPAFAWPDVVRSLFSENPEVRDKAWQTPAGQWLAGFLVPFRTLNDFRAAFGNQEAAISRDVTGMEGIGPAMAQLPKVQEHLPARIDPYTGKARIQEHPLSRQIWGQTKSTVTPLQQLLLEIPGFELGDLVGNYGNATANNLVAAEMGKLLQEPTAGGATREQFIVSKIRSHPKDQWKYWAQKYMGAVRQGAYGRAVRKNRKVFLEEQIRSRVPNFLQEEKMGELLSRTRP